MMRPIGPEQLADLLDRYGGPLVLLARQWTDQAEDALQEAMIHLAGQIPPPDQPVAWLFTAVRNQAKTHARAARRRDQHERQAMQQRESSHTGYEGSLPSRGLDLAEVMSLLDQLPVSYREVVVARIWGQLSFEEIAALIESSVSTAHRRYEAGLNALRSKMQLQMEKPCPRSH